MSAQNPPPPTPGTTSVVNRDGIPTLRPYREDPAIYARDREAGRASHTEAAQIARVEAVARDLAATSVADGTRPAIASELIGLAELAIVRAVDAEASDRAAAVADAREGQAASEIADDAQNAAVVAARTARVAIPDEPVGGVRMTWWWLPLVILPVLVYLELRIGAPQIRIALITTEFKAATTAAAIAVGLTLASEALGLVLGGMVRPWPRATRLVLGALVALLVGCGTWSVVELAAGREHNARYADAKKLLDPPSQGSSTRGFGGLVDQSAGRRAVADPPDDAATRRAERAAQQVYDKGPDLGFTIPVTLLAMLAGAVLSMRVALARDWHERRKQSKEAEQAETAARQRAEQARQANAEARRALEASDLRLTTIAEREMTTADTLLQRFVTEYQRWCAHGNKSPSQLNIPPVQPAYDVLLRILYPGGGRADQAPDDANPQQPPEDDRPPDPPNGGAPEDPPDPPPAEPPPTGPSSRPAGWSWLDDDDASPQPTPSPNGNTNTPEDR